MKIKEKEWFYFDQEDGHQVGPVTLSELDAAHQAGKFDEYSYVTNKKILRQQGPEHNGIPYSMLSRLNVDFQPIIEELHASRVGKMTTVFSGPNNRQNASPKATISPCWARRLFDRLQSIFSR